MAAPLRRLLALKPRADRGGKLAVLTHKVSAGSDEDAPTIQLRMGSCEAKRRQQDQAAGAIVRGTECSITFTTSRCTHLKSQSQKLLGSKKRSTLDSALGNERL